jgi:hypothetical protein
LQPFLCVVSMLFSYRKLHRDILHYLRKEYFVHSVYCYSLQSYTLQKTEVEVTLRSTVSRPIRLGVLPLLEQAARCYIYLSDNYFLYFSCRAPSLVRGRVCNLQCNDASSISSYIVTDGLSASSSWCQDPNGAHKQILISLFDSYFVFSVYGSLPISPMNRVIQPNVEVRSQNHVSAGRNF